MNQEQFIKRAGPQWQEFERLLAELEARQTDQASGFPRLYRALCSDLALCRERRFDAHLVDRLNALVLRGHRHLYERRDGSWHRFITFWAAHFPQAVRSEWRMVLAASAIFYLSGLGVGLLVKSQPQMVYSVMNEAEVAQMEAIYDPASEHHLRPRGYETDAMMLGHYLRNNIGIALKAFAAGIFAGIGSLFVLLFNGLVLGAVAAHLHNVGYSSTFFPFVIGHGAPELTAIVLAAAAGMRLGWAVVAPGRYPRSRALRMAGRRTITLVLGLVGMLVAAAFIEAFWSSSHAVPATVKYVVGAALWVLVTLYFLFAGRQRGH